MALELEAADAAKAGTTTIATVERAADLLLHMASAVGPDFGITELAEELGVSKTAVHRLLATLRNSGMVTLEPRTRRYSLGVSALRLGLSYLDRVDVRRMGRPAIEDLADRTGETATLSVMLGGHERICVDQVLPDREVILSVRMGEPFPLHAGSAGMAFLAFLPAEARAAYLASPRLASLTANTVTDPARLAEIIDEVRERGWSESNGTRRVGAASIAAPVLSHEGFPIAAVGLCGPAERFLEHREECVAELLVASRELSRRFGWND
ncbi:IclR family transcriptional regulator [Nocardioides yefusunii]|uniref:IclR family transcriptional regulator n=1 Tax=Nocardioides yefusunii TaxID=2500546 RepID=A0ABW1QUX4_9ACTN|nr:IclR family transcriptional regulator [Nocardioides yefusunii]